jgi:ATP-binding cassette ChvD family protein
MAEEVNKVIYSMIGVSKNVEGTQILRDINLSYFYGAKIGVLGLNGAGKSSLMRILAGEDNEFEGETHISPGYTIGHLHQEPQLDDSKTVREIVDEGVAETKSLLDEFDRISEKLADPDLDPEEMTRLLERQGEVQEQLDARDAWNLDSHMEMALDALRCPSGETPAHVLSGGERRRVALVRLLLQQPDILLLDEPTNHLDAESVAWLEQHLDRYPGTVIAVTHDRYFLDNVAGWILELDHGHGIPWKGNYSSWLDQKRKRLADEEKQESERQKALQRELEWIRKTPKGQQTKSKARLKRYEQLQEQGPEKRSADTEIFIPDGPRLGDLVIDAEHVSKSYDDTLLIEDMNFSVPAGSVVGIIGPNGAGKSTLFRMITGQEQPDSGELKLGDTVKLAYVEQSREALSDDQPVWSAIADGQEHINLGGQRVNARSYAARFSFTGSDQQKTVRDLSGGERNRVHLARMLRSGANVILLDEPTNDLDVNTMRSLEEAIDEFSGCVLCITHDRWFLDRVATHILAFENDSQVTWFPGNYSAYEQDRRERFGEDAVKPHRTKYRKLTTG